MRMATNAEAALAISLYVIIMVATILILPNTKHIWRWVKRLFSKKADDNA